MDKHYSAALTTHSPTHSPRAEHTRLKFLGCLLGGAIGDALGAPVEFMKRSTILSQFGPDGITTYAPAFGGLGRITDDTQMTLFTAEGLLRGWVRSCLRGISADLPAITAHAYLRWLQTQGERPYCQSDLGTEYSGWLVTHHDLHAQRAPGHTCISALRLMTGFGQPAQNNSKGCGGVMRVAPVGLYMQRLHQAQHPAQTFELGCQLAALTHGHPTGILSAGVFALLIEQLANGATLSEAFTVAMTYLCQHAGHEETLHALLRAQQLAAQPLAAAEAIAQLGEGWVAEEALAIAVYCALTAESFTQGIIHAANHDGDSDSTAAMTGNLLGTLYGAQALPSAWLEPLELHDVIAELAEDLYHFPTWPLTDTYSSAQEQTQCDYLWQKYPGY